MPERPVAIHFPEDDPNKNPKTSNPWYWYVTRQRPYYFLFLGGVWGPGWVRRQAFPVIKILAIDTQPIVPTPTVGYASVEDAIKQGAPPDTFGRIDERSQNYWDLIVKNGNGGNKNPNFPLRSKPNFDVRNGQIRARDSKTAINAIMKAAANQFNGNFNSLANAFNQIAAGVSPAGFRYPGQSSPFNFPLPDGPPTTISRFQQQLDSFVQGPPYLQSSAYIGPISGTVFFNINTFTTQAYAFNINIGQLDPKKWNMSVFPPLDATKIGNGSGSFFSKDYGGYSSTPFPLHGLEIM